MQINNNYEPEIRLKDVFFELLYRWRGILIAAIIGAVLLCGYQYYSIVSVHRDGKLTSEEEQYEISLKEYRMNLNSNQESLKVNQNLMQDLQEYFSKSVYINLDAASMWTATRTYLVTLKEEGDGTTPAISFQDPADYVMASYASALVDDALDSEQMLALLGTDEKRYIKELVNPVSYPDTNLLVLKILCASEDEAKAAIEYFDNRINTVCADKIQPLYPHELKVIGDSVVMSPDETLIKKQQEKILNMQTYQTSIQDAENALHDLKQKGEPTAPGMHLGRMAFFGFVLFAFLMVAYLSVKYLAGGRLHDGTEMTRRYGLFVFGEADHSRARRPGKGIDRLIENWEFGKSKKDAAQTGHQAATLLSNCLSNGNSLILVSTRPSDKLAALQKTLESELKAQDIQIGCKADFLGDSHLPPLSESTNLLIVEEKYESRTEVIRREVEILSMQDAKTIGAIIL